MNFLFLDVAKLPIFFKLFLFIKTQAIINVKHSVFLYVSSKKN